jgi:hypothetical protein
MTQKFSLAAVMACLCASPLAATQPRLAQTPTPTADAVRLRAVRSALQAARPFPVTQASLQLLVDRVPSLPPKLTAAQTAQIRQIAQLARGGASPSLRQAWEQLVLSLPKETTAGDVEALVQYALRESYLKACEDLRNAAEKVKYFNETKAALRSEIQRARSRTPVGLTDASVKQLEDRLNAIGDDAQLANVNLQSAYQKAQQTIATISEISKLIDDTTMATLRKLPGG